jgi:hypothetical protein
VRFESGEVRILSMEFNVQILNCEGPIEAIFAPQAVSSMLIRQKKGQKVANDNHDSKPKNVSNQKIE